MVQNPTKKCPNGSGITRSPGLVLSKGLFTNYDQKGGGGLANAKIG